MMKTRHTRGQRGLVEADLVEAALREIERGGLEGFSLRCAARAIGCDVATLSYHFGSKLGLERAIADRLHGEITAPGRQQSWQRRFISMATGYHDVARRYPNAFPLLLRFWTSGPRDLQLAEEWHQALYDAGIPEADIAAVGCATYSAILGVCAGEIGGLVGKPTAKTLAEIGVQPDLPLTKRLMPFFERLDDEAVFNAAIKSIVAGIKSIAVKRPKAPLRRAEKGNGKRLRRDNRA